MKTMMKASQSKLMSAMPQVKQYENKLQALDEWWGKVALIGKINSHRIASVILDEMAQTKEKFGELHHKLIDNLLHEHLKKVIADNKAKAQVTIDILIRNLFERTADVAFLATDEDIRQFLSNLNSNSDNTSRASIESRLDEYVKKYSVYDEIIILDTKGNVQANLDKNNKITISGDDLINKTLLSNEDYVETFRYSDLQSQKQNTLIYSCKITTNHDTSPIVLGVLCLCFRFDDEIKAIFNSLLTNVKNPLLLMDKTGRVLVSSHPNLVPVNVQFEFNSEPQLLIHHDEEFLTTCCRSNGYQGFYGLGWWAMMMTPVKSAFEEENKQGENIANPHQHLLTSQLFSDALKQIHQASKIINDDLNLVVLNGQVTSLRGNAVEFMPVLEAIKDIGKYTANVFSDSINELQETVISSYMAEVAFMADLAINIMDRNLYERANDCRWWALTSAFRLALSAPTINESDKERLSAILNYINNLYTVYTNLYIFDQNEQIIAVSDPDQKALIGHTLTKNTGANEALTLPDSQAYSVSPFIKTVLYDNKHTYIYNAAIRSVKSGKNVGGIGIVFNSEPEFLAILQDTLPKREDGTLLDGCFGMFVERTGKIISATAQSPVHIGQKLGVDPSFFDLEKGEHYAKIYSFKGVQYILGVAASSGYREYKTTGDYDNDILAFMFVPI
jgi:hypothetical protein